MSRLGELGCHDSESRATMASMVALLWATPNGTALLSGQISALGTVVLTNQGLDPASNDHFLYSHRIV